MKKKKKLLRFPKGILTIRFPFMLYDFSPWQEQVRTEMDIVKSGFTERKNVEWGFSISSIGAEINVSKTK